MSNFRNRPRWIRPPALVEVGEPEPAVESVEPEAAILTAYLEAKPEPKRFPEPLSAVRFASAVPTRDDCIVCSAQRDGLGRLPIGKHGPDCPVVA